MDVVILFGSQTGNGESIAQELHAKCQENEIEASCMSLEAGRRINLKGDDDKKKLLIIVCSTTGNGDAPENADSWWRATKLRSVAKDAYEGVKFSVLGLGDTNYDKFCYMGKMIDKRLGELGGERFFPLTCADEAVGLEASVEQWKEGIFKKIVELVKSD